MALTEQSVLIFKYGGNAMKDENLQQQVLKSILSFSKEGYRVVIVHGGGPFIQAALDRANIASEFIDGYRKTTTEALPHVEMALKGQVNGKLLSIANQLGIKAVGLSGKDAGMVKAKPKLIQKAQPDGSIQQVSLGHVGDIVSVDSSLLESLLQDGYLPIITCLATDDQGQDYNINGDSFAGALAGALKASCLFLLTDVDGLLQDRYDPSTLIAQLSSKNVDQLIEEGIIAGGMIPKLQACQTALAQGAQRAKILNGTKPEQLAQALDAGIGTTVTA